MLTGETHPRGQGPSGDEVIGRLASTASGSFIFRVTRIGGAHLLAQIVETGASAQSSRPRCRNWRNQVVGCFRSRW